jgi:hypothetical protein
MQIGTNIAQQGIASHLTWSCPRPTISASGAIRFRPRTEAQEALVDDWQYAQADRAEELAQLHRFTMIKRQDGRDVKFGVTVTEFAVPPKGQHLRFFAEADKPVNQSTAPFVPSGWGDSILKALADCLRLIRQFPFEG